MDEDLLDLAIKETIHAFGKSKEEWYSKIRQKVTEHTSNPTPKKLIYPSFEINTGQTIGEIRKNRESDQFIENRMVIFAIIDYQELLGYKAKVIREAINWVHYS